jgi:hypothetical protein
MTGGARDTGRDASDELAAHGRPVTVEDPGCGRGIAEIRARACRATTAIGDTTGPTADGGGVGRQRGDRFAGLCTVLLAPAEVR